MRGLLLFCFLQDADIPTLVEQLGDERIAVRDRAETELRRIGTPALDALRKAARDSDSERNRRAARLIDEIRFETSGRIAYFAEVGENGVIRHEDPEEHSPVLVVSARYFDYWNAAWVPGRRDLIVQKYLGQTGY